MKKLRNELIESITTQSVAMFGVGKFLPEVVAEKAHGRLEVFQDESSASVNKFSRPTKILYSLSDISRYGASVCFLEGSARNVLLAKYPNSAQFVLVRLGFSLSIFLQLVGLLRRMFKMTVAVRGVVRFKNQSRGSAYWLVLKNQTSQVEDPIYLSLSDDIGIAGLVEFLNDNDISYVVPRFFESFPELHRPNGGDVDLLVDDEDAPLVRKFLRENPGRIPVDLHTVFGPAPGSGDMPYYMPRLAKAMLKNSTRGPINVKIPNQEDYFYSFLYHILFHKGFFSGLRSDSFSDLVEGTPENDYTKFSQRLASEIGLDFIPSLEAAEAILLEKGFVPKLDTLAAIARVNKWVKLRYFGSTYITEYGLSVLILKKIAHKKGWIEQIEEDIDNQGFEIIKRQVFSDFEVAHLSAILRGGNWYVSLENQEDYLPQSVYVLIDRNHGKVSLAAAGKRESRIRLLKSALRLKYDNSLNSFIHATDDTAQSWEYIDDIWPSEHDRIEKDVEALVSSLRSVPKPTSTLIKTKLHVIRERLKQKILDRFE